MAIWQDPRTTGRTGGVNTATVGVPSVTRDAGLRSYMLSVYNYMASGVLLTGIVAMLVANSSLINLIATANPATGAIQPTLLGWMAIFAPLALVFGLSFGINRMSAGTAQGLYWLYAALIGVQFSTLFLVYTGVSIAQTFFATAAAFLALSLYGYTTKRDLSGIGTFLIMGVVGLIVAMVINMFLRSPGLNLAISAIGVLIFAGLTAYDTQKIKSIYFAVAGHGEAMAKTAVMGALQLYLDFINMFLFLLRFMGDRR
jgi:FtsH-binding integral membrane protein